MRAFRIARGRRQSPAPPRWAIAASRVHGQYTALSLAARSGHFGFEVMRERAVVAGGRPKVWSALDAGTEIELSVPAASAFVGDAEDAPAVMPRQTA